MICITGAVSEEIKGIKGVVPIISTYTYDRLKVFQGKIKEKDVLLVQTGVGKENAKNAVETVVKKFPVTMILSIGFAGGVDEDLSTGDLLLCNPMMVLHSNGSIPKYLPDSSLFTSASNMLKKKQAPFYTGATLTVDTVISSVEAKQKIKKEHTEHNVLAVEMENSAIAEVASAEHIPFLMIRSISDTASDDISFLDKVKGGFSKFSISMHALSHPAIIPDLNKLRKKSQKATATLTAFLYPFLLERVEQ